jgi:hypothetical protein
MAAKRTTHRSSAGKKLYAVRDKSGKFKDIQTYERAHRADLARTSAGEKAAAVRKTAKAVAPTAPPVAAKKTTAKETATKTHATKKRATKKR